MRVEKMPSSVRHKGLQYVRTQFEYPEHLVPFQYLKITDLTKTSSQNDLKWNV